MKCLLILLFSIIPFITFSQENYTEIDTTSLEVDYVFIGFILDEFVNDAIDKGLDSSTVVNHIRMLDGIYMRDLEDKLGVTLCKEDSLSPNGIRGAIFIDNTLFMSYSLLKLTVYHELGHWFNVDHGKGIMRKDSRKAFKVLYTWDRNVKKFMKQIEKNNYSYPVKPNKD